MSYYSSAAATIKSVSWNGTHWKSTANNFAKNSWEFNFEYYDDTEEPFNLLSNSVFKIDIPRTSIPSSFNKDAKYVIKIKYNDMQGAVPFLTNSAVENIFEADNTKLSVHLNQQ